MRRPIFTAACILVLAVSIGDGASARSINDAVGKTTFSWLKAVPDAAVSAAGECLGARDGDMGLFVHPAALAGIEGQKIKLSYVAHYVDTQFGTIGYARKWRDKYVGVKLSYVNYGDFARTDSQGQRTGTFSAGDMGLSVAMGRVLRDDLKVGGVLSYYTSKLDEFTAQAAAADLGVLYYPPFEGVTVGAVLANLGTVTSTYSGGYDELLPLRFTIGARKKLAHAPITLMADVIFPNDNDITYAFGIEATFRDTVQLFAGTRSMSEIDMLARKSETDYAGIATFGVSFALDSYRFSYAYCPNDAIEDAHKVTIGISIP